MSVEVRRLIISYTVHVSIKYNLTYCHSRMKKKGSNSADALAQLLLKEGKVTAKFLERHK